MEYPSVLLNHQLNPEIFSKESLQAYFEKEGWRFYMLDIRELSDQEIALGHILPILPSYAQYYVRYWNNGKLSMIVKCSVNLPVGIQTFYDENGNISEQVDYSKKFGRVSPQDVLSILEREKVISLSEEISRRASSEGFEFSFNLNYDEKTNKLTFETDKFSDYAIIYKDKKELKTTVTTSINKSNTKQTTKAKTGDNANIIGLMMLLVSSMFVMVFVRKKEN